MVLKKRALRRHHRWRLRNKRKRYWSAGFPGYRSLSGRHLGIVTGTPKPCSCWMCGNPRKYSGKITWQEKKAEVHLKELEFEANI